MANIRMPIITPILIHGVEEPILHITNDFRTNHDDFIPPQLSKIMNDKTVIVLHTIRLLLEGANSKCNFKYTYFNTSLILLIMI